MAPLPILGEIASTASWFPLEVLVPIWSRSILSAGRGLIVALGSPYHSRILIAMIAAWLGPRLVLSRVGESAPPDNRRTKWLLRR